MKKREKSENIQHFIVDNVSSHRSVIARLTAEHFQISRAAVARHIALLVKRNILRATGNTKARLYALVPSVEERFGLSTIGLQEDVVWREKVSPLLVDIPENVRTICNHGFTEMLNNAIDHSESDSVHISVIVDSANIYLWIRDFGIGIFKKLMRDLHLHDARHALLELSKGKLTTAAAGGHSGQGIFFTSRIFDEYMFWANGFSFCRFGKDDDWLFESKDDDSTGTLIMMKISRRAIQTANEIMSQYASELHDYGFTKTHVPLMLAKYEGEQLVSRSQAKRLLLRIDQFKHVLLDFKGIATIGQAFADQIFRVFQGEHPEILITPMNENDEVGNMINRARGNTVIVPNPSLFDAIQDDSVT
jgi:arginine repressor